MRDVYRSSVSDGSGNVVAGPPGPARPLEPLERRVLMAADAGVLGVTDGEEPPPMITPIHIEFGGRNVARYTDPAGQEVLIQIAGPGNAVLDIGPEPDRFTLLISGTTAASSLNVLGNTSIGNTTVAGSLRAVKAPTATLSGTLAVSGSLQSVLFGASSGISGGNAITIATPDTPPLKLLIGHAADLSVNTPGVIGSVNAGEFVNEDPGFEGLKAASIGSIKVRGNMDTGVQTTTGGVNTAKFGGELTGFWSLAAGAKSIVSSGPATGTWIVTAGGDIGTIKVPRFEANLTARSLGSLKVNGDMNVGIITLTGGRLGAMNVTGQVVGSQIRVTGDIGKISVAGAQGTNFFAGVKPETFELPESAGQLTGQNRIDNLNIKAGPFANTNVVAHTLGKITVRGVQPDNQGVAYGVAGTTIASFNNVGVLKWRRGNDPARLQGEGDFIVQLLT